MRARMKSSFVLNTTQFLGSIRLFIALWGPQEREVTEVEHELRRCTDAFRSTDRAAAQVIASGKM